MFVSMLGASASSGTRMPGKPFGILFPVPDRPDQGGVGGRRPGGPAGVGNAGLGRGKAMYEKPAAVASVADHT